ncbi:MAG: stage II sporulation protein R [Clostridia bacterium]|nr:stage II sporulation protein R [Clostridia bacterium]
MFEKLLAKRKVKLFLTSLVIGMCVTSVLRVYSRDIVEGISNSVVRLHVVANSNSKDDQDLKLKVRDEVLKKLEPLLEGAKNTEDTKNIIKNNIDYIEEEAEKVIKKYGYTYSVTASFGNYDFPTKKYGNAQFPKGKYDALKIVIEKGEGNNWWCVLYPALCFAENPKGDLPKESEAKLKSNLSKDEYDVVSSDNKINFKFKIVEWFSF